VALLNDRVNGERPFPPGRYPVVVVGSGPGGLQLSYFLKHRGIEHAVISKDEAPGGMFQRFPIFDRLISWTKLHAPVERGDREYEWFDWNSLLVAAPTDFVGVADFMDGKSEFPARHEMEKALAGFAERNDIQVRYGCTWESTKRDEANKEFVVVTSDGEYRCEVAVFAVGMTEPWKPDVDGIEHVPHYMAIKPPEEYTNKRIYLMGKGASAFEIADGLLHVVQSLTLSSPHAAKASVVVRSLAGVRARYMQPMEDDAVGGRTVTLMNASTDRIEKTSTGFRVHVSGTEERWSYKLEFDEVISATGVSVPLGDLGTIGVESFNRGGQLPAQRHFWESPGVSGIYFGGSITQGANGLRKRSGVGAVHGFRYNMRILASHIAQHHFGGDSDARPMRGDDVQSHLLHELSHAPELWNQRMYLGSVVTVAENGEVMNEGVFPLTHFVDTEGADGVAVAVGWDDEGEVRPFVYLRRRGKVSEHMLDGHPFNDFHKSDEHKKELNSLLNGLF
jgi:thioredoxin reductase